MREVPQEVDLIALQEESHPIEEPPPLRSIDNTIESMLETVVTARGAQEQPVSVSWTARGDDVEAYLADVVT